MLLHGLLSTLFHELLDSLRCLKATGVGLIMGHRYCPNSEAFVLI
jgi:hypothetical protein